FALIFEASLIDGARTYDLRVAKLKRLFCVEFVVGLLGKAELPHTFVLLIVTEVLIAGGKRVVGIYLVVEALRKVGAAARERNRVRKRNRIQVGVENRSIHDG